MKKLKDFNVKNKKVLVRCDFNVPLDDKGSVQDDFRIKQAMPTIEYLIKNKAKVILMSHLGRPKGEIIESLRLNSVQKKLEEYLNSSVIKTSDCIGERVKKRVSELKQGDVLLLENLRFYKEEEKNDSEFSQELAELADIYINDAFSVSHRAHSSITGITKYLPSGAGFLLEEEVKILSKVVKNPKRPLVAVIGGAKMSDKSKVIENLKKTADYILIGGKIAQYFTLLKCPEHDNLSNNIYLPIDGFGFKKGYLDIGPETITQFTDIIKRAKTIFWAGPMGLFENPLFENGTKKIGQEIANNKKAYKVIGGGDTLFAISKFGLKNKFDHISTGGGAMLDFLSGKELPGLKVL